MSTNDVCFYGEIIKTYQYFLGDKNAISGTLSQIYTLV